MSEPYIRLKNICKSFGTVQANKNVSIDVSKGEILALLGENGSGKSTLVNMLSGIYTPDSGEIEIGGKNVVFRSPKDAINAGIGMIHQHFKLIDVLTAAENIRVYMHVFIYIKRSHALGTVNLVCADAHKVYSAAFGTERNFHIALHVVNVQKSGRIFALYDFFEIFCGHHRADFVVDGHYRYQNRIFVYGVFEVL